LTRPRPGATVLGLVLAGLLTACGGTTAVPAAIETGPVTLRLGYLANLTHAPALVGLQNGFFAAALGSRVTIDQHTFNAGPDEVTALLSGSLDAAFMGPNPALNAYSQSRGEAVRIVAGATSGGALLVVKPTIGSAADLRGKRIADPQLGGTQDIALRWYLKQQGFKTDVAGGGDVSILPEDNATTLNAFRQGQVDGGWLPEPWASRLVVEAGARVLVDESTLWPGGKFITTNLVVRTDFLKAHPATVGGLLEGLYQSDGYLRSDPEGAQKAANDALAKISGKPLSAAVLAMAWSHLGFGLDPLAATLRDSAAHAQQVGLLQPLDLRGIYDLRPLNAVLAAHGQPAATGL
jgi:NitT/TauT family transport system substrate-binding protein